MLEVLYRDYYLFIKRYSEDLIYVQELHDLNMHYVNVEGREILDMSFPNFTCTQQKIFYPIKPHSHGSHDLSQGTGEQTVLNRGHFLPCSLIFAGSFKWITCDKPTRLLTASSQVTEVNVFYFKMGRNHDTIIRYVNQLLSGTTDFGLTESHFLVLVNGTKEIQIHAATGSSSIMDDVTLLIYSSRWLAVQKFVHLIFTVELLQSNS